MATAVEAKIVNGLLEHFSTLALPEGVETAYPNLDFKPGKKPYVRISVQHNTPTAPHISGSLTIHRGVLLAVVAWPVEQGVVEATELSGSIRDHFAVENGERRVIAHDGIEISIGIDEEPGVQGADQGDVFTEIPVVIPFHVYP